MKIYIRAAVRSILDEDEEVQHEVAANPNTPKEVLAELSELDNSWVVDAVLENPNTPPDILDRAVDTLISDGSIDRYTMRTLGNVARNTSALDTTLIKLAKCVVDHRNSESWNLWDPLLKNPNTPAEALDILVNEYMHNWHAVTDLIIKHPNVTLDVLKKLLIIDNGYCDYFDEIARYHTLPYEFLEYFIENGSAADRRSIAGCNQTPPDLLKQLIADGKNSGYVDTKAITNPSLSEEDLLEIFNSTGETCVTRNPNCPSSILEQVATENLNNATIAAHQNTPISVLYAIFNQCYSDTNSYNSRSILTYLASNPNVPKDISAKLSTYNDWNDMVKKAVAKNPNTDPEVLASMIKTKWEVRQLLAKNPNTPLPTLKKLARDKSYNVRDAVAENPNITEEIINILIAKNEGRIPWELERNPRYKELYGEQDEE